MPRQKIHEKVKNTKNMMKDKKDAKKNMNS